MKKNEQNIKVKPYIVTKKYTFYNSRTHKHDEIIVRQGFYTSRSGNKRVINVLCSKAFTPYYHAVTNQPINIGEMCLRAASMQNDFNVIECIEQYEYFGTGAFLADEQYNKLFADAKNDLYHDWKKKTKFYGQLREELSNQFIDKCKYFDVYADAFANGKYTVESTIEQEVTELIEDFKEKYNNNYVNEDVIESIKDSEQDQM